MLPVQVLPGELGYHKDSREDFMTYDLWDSTGCREMFLERVQKVEKLIRNMLMTEIQDSNKFFAQYSGNCSLTIVRKCLFTVSTCICTCDRLSERNMAVISNEIENIYIHNSRNGM